MAILQRLIAIALSATLWSAPALAQSSHAPAAHSTDATAHSSEPATDPSAGPEPEPLCEFGLVLSGGGARGVAHLGVLEVFEEHGVTPDCIVGASMGSIVGSLYASGHPTDEIRGLLGAFSWKTLYTEPNNRAAQPIVHRLESQRSAIRFGIGGDGFRFPRSILSDLLVNRLLIEHLAPPNFEARRDFAALPIPFRTVGTDLRTGDRIVLAEGDLALAVRASMSVPLAYAPIKWGDALLIDGGLVDNVPVSLAREMGASYAIAVDVSSPIKEEIDPDVLGVTQRIIDLLFSANNSENQMPAEITIRPDLGDHSFADYSNYEQLIEAGRVAARDALDQIPARYKNRTRAPLPHDHTHLEGRTISAVEVSGESYLSERVLRREFGIKPGDRFRLQQALRSLDRLYSTGLLQQAWVDVVDDGDDGVRVILRFVEQYRHTVDLGLAYQDDDQAQGYFRFDTRSPLGGNERVRLTGYASAADLYGAIGLRGQDLFSAHLGYEVDVRAHDDKPRVFDPDGEFVNRALFKHREFRAKIDLPLGNQHLLEGGFRIGSVTTVAQLGLPYADRKDAERIVSGRYVWDNMDSLTLPEHGRFFRVLAEHNIESVGADFPYTMVDVYGRGARRFGKLILEGRFRYGYSTGELPVYEWFRLGGPGLIPGVSRSELWGPQMLAGSLTLGGEPISILRLYARAGLGNVWDKPGEIALNSAIGGLGVGATLATPLGPIQVDYGWAEGGRKSFYLSIGWQSQGIRDISR